MSVWDAEVEQGDAGAGVWSTPTYDEELGLVFVATSNPSVERSKAGEPLIALDAKTGNIAWLNHRKPDDSFCFDGDIAGVQGAAAPALWEDER